MPEIRAISFDVGGTLIEPWPSVGDVYADIARELGNQGLNPDDLNQRFVVAWKRVGGRAESKEDWAAVVQLTFQECQLSVAMDTLFEQLYARFTEPAVWRVFDDVVPTLESLRSQGMRLAVASNWDERLRPLLDRLKLMGFFETVIVSCEVGVRKPERAFFGRVVDALQLSPEQVVHVGDSPEHDLTGASAAGLKAVGIRRSADEPRPPWISTLRSLLTLETLLEPRLNKRS